MKPQESKRISIASYIEQEQKEATKYEFHDGEVFAQAGGSLNHGLLCGNIYAELREQLHKAGSQCKAMTSEVKLAIESTNSFVYPDAMVICSDIQTAKLDKNAVTNPKLVIEVLSKSTADYDRGDKFHLYRQISELQEYILIDQTKPLVEIYYKKPKIDLWQISRIEGLESTIHIQSVDIKIALKDLYFDIDFAKV